MDAANYEVFLERSPAMRLLGEMITFRTPAFILNAFLIASAVTLLVKTNFDIIYILIALFFFLPLFLLIQFRYIHKGGYLMRKTCELKIKEDELYLRVGFPHSSEYQFRSFKLTDVQGLIVKGSPSFGYYIEFALKKDSGDETNNKEGGSGKEDTTSRKDKTEDKTKGSKRQNKSPPPRFGLWREFSDCDEFAEQLSKELKLTLSYDYSLDDLTKLTHKVE